MTAENAALRAELTALNLETAYLRRLTEDHVSRIFWLETQTIGLRHELEQKRRGFSLMAELAVSLGRDTEHDTMFISVSRRLNATLNMQRTAILTPGTEEGLFHASVLQGYSPEERAAVADSPIQVEPEFLKSLAPLIVTGEDPDNRLAGFRAALKLPFFISTPVFLHGEIEALLVSGRLKEERPFMPRLDRRDAETLQTVSAYLAALMAGHRLAEMENSIDYDHLTHLPNTRRTKDALGQTLLLAKRGGFQAAVMFVDLDGFKAVNDTHGHAAGDVVLNLVADRMRVAVRESDIVGRVGGDEFVVVLSGISRPEDAGIVAGKIIEKCAEPVDIHGIRCQVGASVGIAIFPDHGADPETLLAAADEAMYAVKAKGKNAFAFARPMTAAPGLFGKAE